MRFVTKVVIGVFIVLAVIVAVSLTSNALLHGGSSTGASTSGSREAVYNFGKLGFAVSYDARLIKAETDPQFPVRDYGPVYFAARQGPQHANWLPTSTNMTEVRVVRIGHPNMSVAARIKGLLGAKPFGSTVDVRYRPTTVNGMPGVTYNVTLHGERFLAFVLYARGFEVNITATTALDAPPSVWPAVRSVARSVRATL